MKNIIIILNILLCTVSTLTAQAPAKTIVKWSPLSLLNSVAPAVQFGIEHQFAEKWTHQHEIGFIWDGNQIYDGNFWGIRSQNEIRYYIPREKNNFDFFFDRYISLQITGKHLNFRNEGVTIWRNNRAFRELANVDADYNDLAFSIGTGKVVYFKSIPFMIEYGSALGVRFSNRHFYYFPEGTEIHSNISNITWDPLTKNSDLRPFPILNLYFKIGYILN